MWSLVQQIGGAENTHPEYCDGGHSSAGPILIAPAILIPLAPRTDAGVALMRVIQEDISLNKPQKIGSAALGVAYGAAAAFAAL